MEIPLHIISGLHSGRHVEVRFPADLPDHTAWIEVFACVDPTKGRKSRASPQQSWQMESFNGDDPVNGYLVRHIEVPDKYMIYLLDCDVHASTYDEYEVETIQQLETVLTRWISDFNDLQVFRDTVSQWIMQQKANEKSDE